jgi:thymidylate kinase
MINKFILEGLDRLGKSSLTQSIQDKYGYYQVIHYGKPQSLKFYNDRSTSKIPSEQSAYMYQRASFENMFDLIRSPAKIIFDRAHLGEAVYSPIYRGYSGDYIYDLERDHDMGSRWDAKLILLIEDFSVSKHFVDDGLSFDVNKRAQEQDLFLEAFEKSIFSNKKTICVTAPDGNFKSKEDILQEATT